MAELAMRRFGPGERIRVVREPTRAASPGLTGTVIATGSYYDIMPGLEVLCEIHGTAGSWRIWYWSWDIEHDTGR